MLDFNLLENAYFLVAAVALGILTLLVIVDIIMALNDVPGDRLNYILHTASNNKLYFIPLFWGIVIGHLFLGMEYPTENDLFLKPMTTVIVLGSINVALIIIGHFKPNNAQYKSFVRLALLVSGILYGHVFWSMHYISNCP